MVRRRRGPTAAVAQPVEVTTQYAVEEKKKLKKSIGRLDILLLPAVHHRRLRHHRLDGGIRCQAFTWMIFLGVFFFFFFPYALLTSELGSAFREKGGAYEWVTLAFGRRVAAINTLFYWVSNPIWVGGSLAFIALAAFGVFFMPLTGVWAYVFQLAFIWIAVARERRPSGIGKRRRSIVPP